VRSREEGEDGKRAKCEDVRKGRSSGEEGKTSGFRNANRLKTPVSCPGNRGFHFKNRRMPFPSLFSHLSSLISHLFSLFSLLYFAATFRTKA
jgi:hypothetical protein